MTQLILTLFLSLFVLSRSRSISCAEMWIAVLWGAANCKDANGIRCFVCIVQSTRDRWNINRT